MERAKGFEPSTPTLARLCSTPELRPLGGSLRRLCGQSRWRAGSMGLGASQAPWREDVSAARLGVSAATEVNVILIYVIRSRRSFSSHVARDGRQAARTGGRTRSQAGDRPAGEPRLAEQYRCVPSLFNARIASDPARRIPVKSQEVFLANNHHKLRNWLRDQFRPEWVTRPSRCISFGGHISGYARCKTAQLH
jgi:hypothetical protein